MTIKEAKEIDMVDYLAKLGHHPAKVTEPHYWYSSPLHDENTPSFKINRRMNRWKDWGTGQSGNLVDFGILYHQCSISDFLAKIESPAQTIAKHNEYKQRDTSQEEKENSIKVISVKSISSLPLIKYFRERRIPDTIAYQYLKEIGYELKGKNYYALGFKNDAGGYELRNRYIKAASSPKESTFIDNKAQELAVFEGFFNFLSYRAIHHNQDAPQRNFLILNSASFFDQNLPRMLNHNQVHLYLDNDKTGQKFTDKALKLDCQKFRDERGLYKHHKDLNDWTAHLGLSQKQPWKQKP